MGLRREELRAIRREQVDINAGRVQIPREFEGVRVNRALRLEDDIRDIVRTLRERVVEVFARPACLDAIGDKAGDDSRDGATWTTAKRTIGAGLLAVAVDGSIWVREGLYNEYLDPPSRVSLYGDRAARLHDEIVSVAARWGDAAIGRALFREVELLRDLADALRSA